MLGDALEIGLKRDMTVTKPKGEAAPPGAAAS